MRRDREQVLRERLAHAQAEYRECISAEAEAGKLDRDLGLAHPDGLAARRNLMIRTNAALQAYRTALREWRDFVIDQKIPAWFAEPASGYRKGPGTAGAGDIEGPNEASG